MRLVFNPLTGDFDVVSTPGGPDTSIQFNDAGNFSGNASLTWEEFFLRAGPDTYGPAGWAGWNVGLEIYRRAGTEQFVDDIYVESYVGDIAASQGIAIQGTMGTQGAEATHDVASVLGVYGAGSSYLPAGRRATTITGGQFATAAFGGGDVTYANGILAAVSAGNESTIETGYGFTSRIYELSSVSGLSTACLFFGQFMNSDVTHGQGYGIFIGATGGKATSPHPLWLDERGVFTVQADNSHNSVYQAVPSLNNPQFTRFVAGAVDYERISEYWVDNVATFGVQVGGTGTNRALNLIGAEVQANGVVVVTLSGSQTLTNKTLTSPTIAKIGNLTSNGFVKTSGGDGTLSVDTSTYLTTAVTSATGTANQVNVSAATGAVTFSLPQNIDTGATPTFAGVTLGTSGILVGGTNTIDQRNSTSAQTFNVYNTFTDASNYERGFVRYSSNVLQIGHEGAGTGNNGRTLAFRTAGFNTLTMDASNATFGVHILALTANIVNSGSRNITSGTIFGYENSFNYNPSSTSTMLAVPVYIHPTINYSAGTPGAGSYEALKIAVTETALPTGTNYLIRASAGAAGTTDKFTLKNNGDIFTVGFVQGNVFMGTAGGNPWWQVTSSGVAVKSDIYYGFTSSSSAGSSVDALIVRAAAATLQFGSDVNGAAVNQQLQAANGITGTDKTGGNFTLASGKGTGAGAVSQVLIQTPTALGSGTTAQSLTTRLTVDVNGIKATGYLSSDGTAGVTAGPFTTITSITVKDGLVTALTGS